MAKRISRRLRKLAPRRALAFMVSAGENGAVELTLYVGRRSLSRELTVVDAVLLARLLTENPEPDSWRLHERAMGRVALGELFCRAQAL